MVVDVLLARELLYVTGKGGTGKTTVTAALAIAAAARGRSVMVCEVDGADRLAGALRGIAGVTHYSIEPRQALKDWMRAQPGAPWRPRRSVAREPSPSSWTPRRAPRSS